MADLVPEAAHGTALGIQAALSGTGLLFAGIWAGLAWNGTGRGPFVLSGVVAGVITGIIFGFRSLLGAGTVSQAPDGS